MQQRGSRVVSACVSHRFLPSVHLRLVAAASILLLFLAASAWAEDVTLAWDPVSATNLGGYKLYYGPSSRTYTTSVKVGLQTTYTLRGLSAGQTYYFAVTVYNTTETSESAFSNEVTTTLRDATQPTVSLTAPRAGATVSGTIPVTATASDNVGVVGVQFLLDGNPLGSEQTGPTFALSWATTGVANGSHTLAARARDAAGNTALATAITVTVSNTASALVANFTATPTRGSVPLTVAFTDTSTGGATQWAWQFGDGGSSTTRHPSYTYRAPGSYTVRLTVTNAGGSNTLTRTNYIAVTAPAPVANFSATPTSGRAPLTVAFTDTSTGGATQWAWQFGDGGSSTTRHPSYTYRAPGSYTVRLTVTGAGGSHTLTKTGFITVQPALLEVGNITIDYVWKRIAFRQAFVDPIVVATPLGTNDRAPATIRLRDIGPTGFEIRVQEWDYLDGTHSPEPVSYLVMERGKHTLGSGIRVEAGRATVQRTSDINFNTVSLTQTFARTPVVLTSVTSVNEATPVHTRIRRRTTSSFQVKLEEQLLNPQSHLPESVHFIAWEPSSGTVDGLTFEVQTTPDVVTDTLYNLNFLQAFPGIPVFLAGMQTTDGTDPATLRRESVDAVRATIYIQEENSRAHDLTHTTEVIGYMTFMYQ